MGHRTDGPDQMTLKAVLLGPDGQLGHDVRRTHATTGAPFELLPLPRTDLDIAVPGEIERVLGDLSFDVVVNCAAYTRVDAAEDDSESAFAVNAHAVRSLAAACAARKARLIHISTDYVFGGDSSRDRPLPESAPVAPVNVYGESKALGETLASEAHDDVVLVRTASLFGMGGIGGRGANFVETVIRNVRETRELRVVDDRTMSPTASCDVARVLVRMITQGCTPSCYHVVNSGSATWFEFARDIVRGAGIEATVTPCRSSDYPSRAARPRYSVLDNSRAAAEFGAMAPWQEALERYLHARRRRHA